MEWLNVIMHPDDLYEMLIRRKLISGASAVLKTVTGISPLTILKVASNSLSSCRADYGTGHRSTLDSERHSHDHGK